MCRMSESDIDKSDYIISRPYMSLEMILDCILVIEFEKIHFE